MIIKTLYGRKESIKDIGYDRIGFTNNPYYNKQNDKIDEKVTYVIRRKRGGI